MWSLRSLSSENTATQGPVDTRSCKGASGPLCGGDDGRRPAAPRSSLCAEGAFTRGCAAVKGRPCGQCQVLSAAAPGGHEVPCPSLALAQEEGPLESQATVDGAPPPPSSDSPAALRPADGSGFRSGSTASPRGDLSGPRLHAEPDADAQVVAKMTHHVCKGRRSWGSEVGFPPSPRPGDVRLAFLGRRARCRRLTPFALASPWRPAFALNRTRSRKGVREVPAQILQGLRLFNKELISNIRGMRVGSQAWRCL